MPDTPVDSTLPRSYPFGMETHVAVLEQMARTTSATLERMERRLDLIGAEQRTDFRWLLGITLAGFGTMIGLFAGLLGVMAHGFHWL
ncbi:MAG: hypothetical protein ABI224_09045 [Acetobacteraceae bacterium]